ncbi:MAG: hypothetical protein IPK26_09015 [Planctomycetes bacterium]|nr:hypothetical protein [Planctomycetota bacterium]
MGELRPDDPEVVAKAAASPGFRSAVEELAAALSDLDAAGAQERAWLRAADAPQEPALRPDLVDSTIRRLAADPVPTTRRSRAPAWLWFAAAAAAGLLAWATLWRTEPAQPPDDRPLSGQQFLTLDAPRLEQEVLVLSWRTDLAVPTTTVEIWAGTAGGEPLLIEQTSRLEWRLQPADWRVLKDATGPLSWRASATQGGVTRDSGAQPFVLPR